MPNLVRLFVEIAMIPEATLRQTIIPLFFDMLTANAESNDTSSAVLNEGVQSTLSTNITDTVLMSMQYQYHAVIYCNYHMFSELRHMCLC